MSDYLFSFQKRTDYLFSAFLRSEYLFPKSARPLPSESNVRFDYTAVVIARPLPSESNGRFDYKAVVTPSYDGQVISQYHPIGVVSCAITFPSPYHFNMSLNFISIPDKDFFRNVRRVYRFILCLNYMMFPLVL